MINVHQRPIAHSCSKPVWSTTSNFIVVGSRRISWLLIASGVGHLAWLFISGADWEGPVSPRKPGLFGVSAGLTGLSISWVLPQLRPRRNDGLFNLMTVLCLLIEVSLITIQYWRGVPSHFNRLTTIDAAIEKAMLAVILIVTSLLAMLCWRSVSLPPMRSSRRISIQAGLFFLLVSCLLGIAATIVGEVNLANGMSADYWHRSGVLKYPHGATLHALQLLPAMNWLFNKLQVPNSLKLMRVAVGSHALFLIHAIWQTCQDRARLDLDLVGGSLLFAATGMILLPVAAIAIRIAVRMTIPLSGHTE